METEREEMPETLTTPPIPVLVPPEPNSPEGTTSGSEDLELEEKADDTSAGAAATKRKMPEKATKAKKPKSHQPKKSAKAKSKARPSASSSKLKSFKKRLLNLYEQL
jgi:hypothetical protein